MVKWTKESDGSGGFKAALNKTHIIVGFDENQTLMAGLVGEKLNFIEDIIEEDAGIVERRSTMGDC